MAQKKWTISLIILLVLFLYVFFHFITVTKQLEKTVAKLQHEQKMMSHFPHVILISQEFDNPYWRKIEQGAKEAGKQYDVNIEYIGPLRTSIEEQVKLLEKAIASRVDGIIVQNLKDEAFTPLIDKAISRNIPVITIDADAPKSRRIAYVGTNNFEAGRLLGQEVASRVEGKQEIGIMIGTDTSENQRLRLQGFLSVITEYPRLKVVSVASSNISRIQASIQAEQMLRKHPNISVMVGTSALDAIGIRMAIKNLHREDIQIFGFDDVEETMEAIKEGDIVATVVQKPYDMGYSAVKLMADHLSGKQIDKEHFTATGVIDYQNIQQGRNK
ncbi:sugar-binding protein [Anoxybacillus suryakundensis]|uniref:ABC-type sugar transport system, periplasmic component, contains N-terminal xre family HTH domain n=1 Tax=Anoxybacillus suryakundensis TaxID=1325335 RepID=A0A0K6GNW4_9BACL|nr:sugar-binding protein [Anoxybacillus suryakundensis]CUA80213.1 ABC-type sugar transport system, periplasmic component, contains N-terminal xre family HTH domain [Anoxybacillus suryakundensis]